MTTRSRWITPVFGFVVAGAMFVVEFHRTGSAWEAGLGGAIVAGYSLAILALRSRSETVGALAGFPVDERWASINQRALAFAAQLFAVVVVTVFLIVEVSGGDAMPYAWMAIVITVGWLFGLIWYRSRS